MTAPQQPRWYCVNNMGMATLCADQADAENVASDCDTEWPRQAPHRAVQLVEVSGCGIGRDEILSMALEVKAGVYLPAEAGLPATWVGQDFAMLERFAALVAAKVIARTPPPPLVVSMSDVDQAQLAAMLEKRQPMPLVAAPDDSALDTERAARIAAQVENEALKAERARSGLAHRKAVQEAVREAEDAAKLATATACADVCADMAQQLRGHGDVAGAEIAEALRDAVRARGAA